MKVRIKYNKKYDIERIIKAAHCITTGFYQARGFLVLPRLVLGNCALCYFPDLQYEKIPNFWQRVAKIKFPNPRLVKLNKNLQDIFDVSPLDDKKISAKNKEWGSIESRFFKTYRTIFDKSGLTGLKVDVWLSQFGTSMSFNRITKDKGSPLLHIELRYDAPASEIIRGILSATVQHLWFNNRSWYESWSRNTFLVDFLFTQTKFAECINTPPRILDSLVDIRKSTSLLNESKKYCARLGFPYPNAFTIHNGIVYINNKKPYPNLSTMQNEIMKLLIKKEGKVVSYDMIADLIWGEKSDEKYSKWAIAKHIERLRRKILKNGIVADVLIPIRGEGYMLIS